MKGSFQVVGLGQCCLDFLGRIDKFPQPDQKTEIREFLVQGGGPVATALVTLARLGVSTAFVGRVGGDDFGRQIRVGLLNEKVDCGCLQVDQEGTSQAAFISAEEETGHRNIFWHRGEGRPLTLDRQAEELISQADILHLDGLQQEAAIDAAKLARDKGVTTVLDSGTWRPGIDRLLPLIDHLVVSENFAHTIIAGDDLPLAMELMLQYGADAVTVTRGVRGSYSLERSGAAFHQSAFPVQAVDTTGCGDVFHGGYIFGLLQNWPLAEIVRFASACAALKARALGGRTGIAPLDEVTEFLKRSLQS
jgi:ribokinase